MSFEIKIFHQFLIESIFISLHYSYTLHCVNSLLIGTTILKRNPLFKKKCTVYFKIPAHKHRKIKTKLHKEQN